MAAVAALFEGTDPHRVPQDDTSATARTNPPGCADVFDKNAARADLPEAGVLTGFRGARPLGPVQHPSTARERRTYVLQLLFDQGRITRGELRKANAAPLPEPDNVHLPATRPRRYFVDYVADQLVGKSGAERVFSGSLEMTTTHRPRACRRRRARRSRRSSATRAARLPHSVAIDPRSEAIKAMSADDYRRSQSTWQPRRSASQAHPSSRSYSPARSQADRPSTELDSKPVKINAGDRIWPVSNYEGATSVGSTCGTRWSPPTSVYAQ